MDILTSLSKLFDRFGKEYGSGEVIFEQGQDGADMYFILDGNVDVKVTKVEDGARKELTLVTLGPRDFFGEMSLLNGEQRSATIQVSKAHTRVIRISPGNFDTIIKLQPQIAVSMLKELARRLRATSKKIAEATSK